MSRTSAFWAVAARVDAGIAVMEFVAATVRQREAVIAVADSGEIR
jgi:hypothetical protein